MSVARSEGLARDHTGPWTLEQVLALPEDRSHRTELIGGALLMSPNPARPHQMASRRLANALETAARDAGFPVVVYEAVNVVVPSGLLIPDIALIDVDAARDADGLTTDAEAVLMVVEIASPSNRVTDIAIKPPIYAAAGIPWYWRLDLRPAAKLIASQLVYGGYTVRVVAPAGRTTTLAEPFKMSLDPLDLLRLY